MKSSKPPRLNEEQRQEATRRVLAGEKAAALAVEYGVTRAYISLLKATALDPERFKRKSEAGLKRQLTAKELAEFREAIETSDPSRLGLDPPTRAWGLDHGYQLADRLFGKRPSVRVLKECMAPVLRRKRDSILRRPQPPEPHSISQLSLELAKNEDFVEYYLSPLSEKIARREYELALADWVARYGDATEVDLDAHPEEPRMEPPVNPAIHSPGIGRRTGKHAQSKGSPFTPAKKKKRKKR